jgi:hypothetical protein
MRHSDNGWECLQSIAPAKRCLWRSTTSHSRVECFGVCPFEERGELFLSGRRKGHKDEEAVVCVNCDAVPRATRRTGVFYRVLSRRRQRSVQRVAPRTGETSSLLKVECSKSNAHSDNSTAPSITPPESVSGYPSNMLSV